MFNEIEMKTWPRAELFYYFSQMAPTGYSLTVDVDVTNIIKVTKEKGFKFFPAYLWLVTKCLNKQTEFKCAVKDGKIGYYDTLTPLYATWHEDTKTFSFMWTEFSEDFRTFHEAYIRNQEKYGSNHGVLSQPGTPPENAYTVSTLPWINFSHFAVNSYENKPYYFPSIEAGKYHQDGERIIMPLSISCHHATTDGWHITTFLEDLRESIMTF